MKRIACAVGAATLASVALARPDVNSAEIFLRVFNDDPTSNASSVNNYPDLVSITDESVDKDGQAGGFANRHAFRLADNGQAVLFRNSDSFSLYADVRLSGNAVGLEGGLSVSPWWSPLIDGQFMLNAQNGEIAIFGGRLPFYSFTANHGVTYTRGEWANLGVVYDANSNTEQDPGTIQYFVSYGGNDYASPVIPFDEGNPNEDPPYGLWGILNDAMVGGYMQVPINRNDPTNTGMVEFGNIKFIPAPGAMMALALGGLVAARRRR